MFGIGWTEAIFIAIIVLLFVGPRHLPGLLRKMGRVVGELKNASRELRNQLDLETADLESPGRIARDLKREALDLVQSPYEEARRMDEQLRRELRDAARLEPPAPSESEGDGPGSGGGGDAPPGAGA